MPGYADTTAGYHSLLLAKSTPCAFHMAQARNLPLLWLLPCLPLVFSTHDGAVGGLLISQRWQAAFPLIRLGCCVPILTHQSVRPSTCYCHPSIHPSSFATSGLVSYPFATFYPCNNRKKCQVQCQVRAEARIYCPR